MTTIIIEIREGPNHDNVLRQVVQALVSIGGPLDFRANDLPDRSTPPGWAQPAQEIVRRPDMDLPGGRLAYGPPPTVSAIMTEGLSDHVPSTEARDSIGRRIGNRRRKNGNHKK